MVSKRLGFTSAYELALWLLAAPSIFLVAVGLAVLELDDLGTGAAAWVQAIGSVLAIVATVAISRIAHRRDQQAQEDRDRIASRAGTVVIRQHLKRHLERTADLDEIETWQDGRLVDWDGNFERWTDVAKRAQVAPELIAMVPATASMGLPAEKIKTAIYLAILTHEAFEGVGRPGDGEDPNGESGVLDYDECCQGRLDAAVELAGQMSKAVRVALAQIDEFFAN